MAKKATKPVVEEPVKVEEVKEEVIEQPVVEEPVKVEEAPERVFYVEHYGNVMAKDEKDAKAKAEAIIAKIRG